MTSPTNLEIRQAYPEDAAACIQHVHRISEEFPENITCGPGEFDVTLEQEQKLFADAAAADNALFLLAVVDGNVVGLLHYKGSQRRAIRHAVTLGISIRKAWCDRGVGTALLKTAIEHARAGGVVRRIELRVYTHNQRAIHVYRKLGFIEEGRRKNAAFKNGQYIDDLVMALLLD